ncbi:MAG: hypothetical protein AAFO04_02335 [Cyanobacteria bacterium J06592_8]
MIENTRTRKGLPDPVPDDSSDQVQNSYKDLKQALANLPEDAKELIS